MKIPNITASDFVLLECLRLCASCVEIIWQCKTTIHDIIFHGIFILYERNLPYERDLIHNHFIVKAVHELSMTQFSLGGYHWKLKWFISLEDIFKVYSWPFCQVVNILPCVS